jgi:glycosyltransferase involved in cell wall biosynthesis
VTVPPADAAFAAAFAARRGLDERPFVLWIGTMEPRKNVGVLVAAMASLKRRHRGRSPAMLVLAGYAGWGDPAMIRPADREWLGEDLIELGRVSERELWALYERATVFAFPSLNEGFGFPVLEAMSRGVPVLCADIPVLRDVGAAAATYIAADRAEDWADAIQELLDDGGRRDVQAQAGLRRAATFTAERHIAAVRKVHREALALR